MTIDVANTELTNTFDNWRVRTNELADAMSGQVLTVDSNTTVGNAAVDGYLEAGYLVANNIGGGVTGSPDLLTITTNVDSIGTLFTFSSNTKFDGANNFLGLAANLQISGANATHSNLRANNSTDKLFFDLNPQSANTRLDDIVAGAVTNNYMLVANGSNWLSVAPATTRAALDLEVGTDVQAYDITLTELGGLAPTKGRLAVANGTVWTFLNVGSNNNVLIANTEEATG
jgi:regulator of RNase E activity RraA